MLTVQDIDVNVHFTVGTSKGNCFEPCFVLTLHYDNNTSDSMELTTSQFLVCYRSVSVYPRTLELSLVNFKQLALNYSLLIAFLYIYSPTGFTSKSSINSLSSMDR
ncbi:hypothetical protein GEMRC1_011068 [Eukaryota sp. GEM-RC1]